MLYIYLDVQALEDAGAVPGEELRGQEKQYWMKVLILGDRRIDIPKDGAPFVYGSDILADIPPDISQFVIEISFYDNFGYGLSPRRQVGFYRLATASAELEVGRGGEHYHLKIRAGNLKDLRELRQLIRLGQIWPVLDYEAEQVPPPFRHLRDLLREAWALIRRNVRERLHRIQERVTI